MLGIGVIWFLVGSVATSGQEILTLPPLIAKVADPTPALSREAVVRWALENNPELAAIRQLRGIAAAGVVIARTYPFNPVLESRIEATPTPNRPGVTNPVLNEHKVLLEVELHGQKMIRQQVATAALTRTEWDIAAQELLLVSRVMRAYDGVLYRQRKLQVSQERIQLNEVAATQIAVLRKQGKLNPADPFLIRNEIDDATAQRRSAELALAVAEQELQRAAGAVREPFPLGGVLSPQMPQVDRDTLTTVALDRRPELRSREAAVAEAAARLRLEQTNRYGNPTIGPSYGLDVATISSIGLTVLVPLPAFNTHRGDILQRQAEQTFATLQLRQAEVQVRQDVDTAVARAEKALAWTETFEKQVLPNLRKSLEAAEKLFAQGDQNVDVVRVLEIRRSLLKGEEAYLDALWEVALAKADLIAAVGDLGLFLDPSALPSCPPCRSP
jgi:cobalt-zinc-cadmium efflux system outer membrane protein